uniref:Insulin like growth factor binding protein 4 n=1 Tax=Cairina moschata TaxID=8855 RepID=A0A8C3BNZ9_CAIMO
MQQEKWCSGQTHSVTGSGGTCSFLKSGRAEQRGSHDAPLPAANIWDCRLAPLVVQARMPSAAFPSWPAGEKEEIDHPNNSFSPCSIHDRKCLQKQQAKRVNNGNKMRNSGSPYHREETRPIAQGSCQSELHRALERLAASQTRTHEDLYVIPIPNCDRNGNFHPKQCHPALDGQRGKCWCVDRKTGVKLPGFLELKGDLDCHQPADSM